jgi:hypothetical protein
MLAPAPPPCVPSGAHIVAVHARAAVYSDGGRGRFACYGRGRPITLISDSNVNTSAGRLTFKGRYLALELTFGGLDTSSAAVEAYDLRQRRRIENHIAVRSNPGPEFIERVTALRLRSDGAIAWIGTADSLAGSAGPGEQSTHEVHGARHGHDHVLATGTDIAPRSLKLRGRLVVWQQAGAAKTARL